MDIRYILQDCLFLLFLLPIHGLFESDDYEDAGAFGRCPWIRNKLKNGRVRYRYKGRVAKFLCDSGFELAGKRSSTCVRGQWSNTLPVCVARGCNRAPTVANGRVTEMYRGALLVYDCNPGYTLVGDSSIHCDGHRWNATPATCVVSIHDPETNCDFETYDLCGWTHDPIHDFDWRRNQFATPSGHVGTGPSFDHTFGENKAGYYLYIEASSPRKPNDVARLFSPVYHPDESGGCFIFWYHMYGTNTGGLRVYLKPESHVFNELSPIWYEFGDHGNQWLRGNISVPVFRENFQIVIEAIRGDGYMGDSAIDDVYLTKQDCESMENETDIQLEDSTDSCRGRCRVPDSTEACGCDDSCLAAENCCSDYTSLCLETMHTLLPETDEPLPGTYTVTPSLRETTERPIQVQSTKLFTDSPYLFVTSVLSTTVNSASSSIHYHDFITSPILSMTPMNTTEGSKSTSAATSMNTVKSLTPDRKPETVIPNSTSSTTMIVTSIADTSLSSTTEKTANYASTAGKTTLLKTSPSTTISLTSTISTTSLKTSTSTTTLKTSTSTTTLKTSPITTTSVRTSSLASSTENTTSSTQTASAPPVQIPTKSTSTGSTYNQALSTETSSTQLSRDINQTVFYLTTESRTFPKLTFPDSTSTSTTPVIISTSTPRYNLRPRKTSTVLPTTSFSQYSSLSSRSTLSSTSSSKTETSTVPLTFSTTSQTRSFTRPLAFTTKISTRVPINDATTKASIIQTTTAANSFESTKFRYPRPSMLTFPSSAPTTAESFERISSKSSDIFTTVITVVIIVLLCVIGGIVLYIKKYKGKRQSKLDDNSEMRFLPDSDYMEYSDASALDKIMVK